MRYLLILLTIPLLLGSCEKEDDPIINDVPQSHLIVGKWIQDSTYTESTISGVKYDPVVSDKYDQEQNKTYVEYLFTDSEVTSWAKTRSGSLNIDQGTRAYTVGDVTLMVNKTNQAQLNRYDFDILELSLTSLVLKDAYKSETVIAPGDTAFTQEIYYYSR